MFCTSSSACFEKGSTWCFPWIQAEDCVGTWDLSIDRPVTRLFLCIVLIVHMLTWLSIQCHLSKLWFFTKVTKFLLHSVQPHTGTPTLTSPHLIFVSKDPCFVSITFLFPILTLALWSVFGTLYAQPWPSSPFLPIFTVPWPLTL